MKATFLIQEWTLAMKSSEKFKKDTVVWGYFTQKSQFFGGFFTISPEVLE